MTPSLVIRLSLITFCRLRALHVSVLGEEISLDWTERGPKMHFEGNDRARPHHLGTLFTCCLSNNIDSAFSGNCTKESLLTFHRIFDKNDDWVIKRILCFAFLEICVQSPRTRWKMRERHRGTNSDTAAQVAQVSFLVAGCLEGSPLQELSPCDSYQKGRDQNDLRITKTRCI